MDNKINKRRKGGITGNGKGEKKIRRREEENRGNKFKLETNSLRRVEGVIFYD